MRLGIPIAVALGCTTQHAPVAPPAPTVRPLVIGETFTVDSKLLGERRVINVYLPPDYATTGQRYPVLYMPDGGIKEDLQHITGLVDVSIKNEVIRPMMVVGIENTERRRDLVGPTTVAKDRERAPHAGGADRFRRFLRDELKPLIATRYRTTAESTLIGESLAGLFVVETLLVEPALFDSYIAVDPSVWWNAQAAVRGAAAKFDAWSVPSRRLYVTTGDLPEMQQGVAVLLEAWRSHHPAGLDIHYDPLPDQRHNTIFPVAALRAFRHLFAKPHPAQPAEAQLTAWLAAFDAADRARLAAFRDQFASDSPLADPDRTVGFARQTGGFDVRKIEESTASHVVGLLQENDSEQFARATLDVDATPAHRITSFDIRAVPTPDEFRPHRLTETEAIAALGDHIAKLVAADRFAGAVMIAKHAAPIFAAAYGMADRDRRVPNTLDTRFRIGSMNKMFTAAATLQLVQAGKLALASPLRDLVRDYPNPTVASKVTVHHLLSHTGGTGDIFGPEFDARRRTLRTLGDYVALYGKRDLGFEPGAKWAYSNYGFVLLGVVIERVTGKSYYDWVKQHVFDVAGMAATASLPEDQVVEGRAIGYLRDDPTKPWLPNTDTLPYRGTSAGGGYSTVGDLVKFAAALTGHKLLDAKHTELLTAGHTPTPRGSSYAYGFQDDTVDGVRCFGHGGGAPGMNGELLICDSGYTIAVLANLDPPVAGRIAEFLRARLPAN